MRRRSPPGSATTWCAVLAGQGAASTSCCQYPAAAVIEMSRTSTVAGGHTTTSTTFKCICVTADAVASQVASSPPDESSSEQAPPPTPHQHPAPAPRRQATHREASSAVAYTIDKKDDLVRLTVQLEPHGLKPALSHRVTGTEHRGTQIGICPRRIIASAADGTPLALARLENLSATVEHERDDDATPM
eukprot:CAMPEP_0180499408 /NCGR_PEP_ID=MMETSP1036_2-20121128/43850_1 /TAXON_ID=632150 /ORGANISM="Azadinium spinosum, Strain 3D9" /LENGTH=188 /DNA_ID=CAMNT_0022508101 /DNA_START=23 /DNA_END=587 /DNA_ORIENTATION=-